MASRAELISWAAPIATISVVSVSLSLTIPLYSLLLERMGESGTAIGLNHTMSALAMVMTAPFLPMVVARIGLVRLMLGALVLMALTLPTIPLIPSPWWWGFLRFCWGIAGSTLFFASEFWLVAVAPDRLRGRLIAIYSIVLAGFYMTGPIILNLTGADGFLTYAVPTGIVLAAMIPVALGRHSAPPGRHGNVSRPLAPFRFFQSDPTVIWGVVLFGAVEFGANSLITVWGIRIGFTPEAAVALVFWIAFGTMLSQLPIGWAADRIDRRRMLVLAGIGSTLAPLAIAGFSTSYPAVAAGAMIWGGIAVALYTLALTELGARYSGGRLAEANAAVILAYGVGALISPTAFGAAMEIAPPNGMLWLAAGLAMAYVLLAAWRLQRRREYTPRGS